MPANFRLHPIHRDANEKYLVILGRGDIEVMDITGTAATLTVTADAATYLSNNNPTADELRLVSIKDFTLIVNTKVVISTVQAVTTFSVTNTFDTYTKLTSRIGVPDAYYRATSADSPNPAGFYQYTLAAADNGFAYWTSDAMTSSWKTVGSRWNNNNRNPMGFRVRFRRQNLTAAGLAYTASSKVLLLAGAFANYTFYSGDEIHITGTGGTSLAEGWYAIASAGASPDNEVVLTGAYRDTADELQDWSGGNKTDSDSDYISVSGGNAAENFFSTPPTDMDNVAERLQAGFRLITGLEDMIISWRAENNTLVVISPFRGTQATVLSFTDPDFGDSLKDLTNASEDPFRFERGTATAGTGSPTTDTDEIDDRWTQVAAPGEDDTRIDASTMPVKLVRDTITPLAFTVDVIDWTERLSGTHDTNPAPSVFVDEDGAMANITLSDIGFYNNRMILLGDENIVFSQSGDVFNFFLDDASNIVDSDPIDKALSSNQVTLGDYVVPYRNTIVVTTKAGVQFEMNSPDTFKAATVSISPSTAYIMTANVRPRPMHNGLFFTGPAGNRSALYEYRFEEGTVGSIADEVSVHANELLPPDIKNLQTASNFNTVFILPYDCNIIYVYQQFKVDGRRQQQAWSKWIFDSSYSIDDIAVIEDELYMLVRDGNNFGRRLLEKINIARNVVVIDSDCDTDTDPTC